MVRKYLFLLLFVVLRVVVYSQSSCDGVRNSEMSAEGDSSVLTHSVFVLGDLEYSTHVSKSIKFLHKQLVEVGKKGTLLLLGDIDQNIVLQNKDEDRQHNELLKWLVSGFSGNLFVIPGEKEWGKGLVGGIEQIRNREKYWEDYFSKGDIFLPSNGCPGPVEISLTPDVVLLLVDSQWWLYPGDRPMEECEFENVNDFLITLSDALLRNKEKKIIMACHHPVYSGGKYGGHFPFIGPVELFRKIVGTTQDFAHPFYRQMRYYARTIFKNLNDLVLVSAHDQSLQYVKKDNLHQVIAGSASRALYVNGKEMNFVDREVGFARLDYYKDHKVWLHFWAFGDDGEGVPHRVFSKLIDSRIVRSPESLVRAYEKLEFPDSVVTRASTQYHTNSRWKKAWLGENYRKVWAKAISAPVIDLGKEKGGLSIIKRGGGQQTLSLRLQDSMGREYVLRSIEKYTQRAIPQILRGTFAAQVLQDGISGSHPYGALAVPLLADAAGVYHTNPRVVYVPDDPRLGIYRDEFKNNLYLFEERPTGDMSDVPGFGASKKNISTQKLLKRRYESYDYQVDQLAVLRARLFDLWLNDWDRHDDQWRWAISGTKSNHIARPIPRDRDQVFFYNQGVLPWLVRRKWAIRKFQPFDSIFHDVVGLAFNARYFDHTFLTMPSREDWKDVAKDLQMALCDSIIDQAIGNMPDKGSCGKCESLAGKLKARRDHLQHMALNYYSFLSRKVDVVGTNNKEEFVAQRLNEGKLSIKIYPLSKKGNRKKYVYSRVFEPHETREVRLYGLKGKDKFTVFGLGESGVKLRIIGGTGADVVDYKVTGGPRNNTWVYDSKKSTLFQGNDHFRCRLENGKDVKKYDRHNVGYNMVSPAINLNIVSDDGVILGGGVVVKTQGFGQKEYATRHNFLCNYSFRHPSIQLEYKGEWKGLIGSNDMVWVTRFNTPNFQGAYYGLGNQTVRFRDRPDNYYRYRMGQFFFNPMIRRRFGSSHSLFFGTFYHWAKLQATANRFVTDFSNLDYDLDPLQSFKESKFWGVNIKYALDTRDDSTLPTRGVYWVSRYKWFYDLYGNYPDFHHMSTDLRMFVSPGRVSRSVLAMRIGAAHNSPGYPFYHANTLGGKNNLRGFRRDRFAGDDIVYQNLDFRVRLKRFHSYFLGGEIGVLAFNDLGRVWLSGESSKKWHHGYGCGIWVSPFRLMVLTATYGHSIEDDVISIQFKYLF